jgi:RNA polymerase primary sigma factor
MIGGDSEYTVSGNSISIRNYFKDIRKIDVLSSEEQIQLAILARNGDQRAMNKLVESNLRFVLSIAKEYLWSGVSLEELASEGNIGLIRAVRKFDETKGFKFISYAMWWVRQAIMQSIYENGSTVRLPMNKIGTLNKINKISDKLIQTLDREPTIDEIVNNTDLSERDVRLSATDIMTCSSIDDRVNDDGDSVFSELIPIESTDETEARSNVDSLREQINEVFAELSERENKILNMFFGLNGCHSMTLKEIGKEMNLTNERVRQIKEFALRKLRTYNNSTRLEEFLKCRLSC